MTKEQRFYKLLKDIFVGAKIEGKGGFVNLMRIKSNYYRKNERLLREYIEELLKKCSVSRDELFDKLHSFFSLYFTKSGSIHINSTPINNNVYEKVYTDERDVALFWKTQMLYYVKTDRIFSSIPVEFNHLKFYFDASTIENKRTNEKRTLVFKLDKIKEDHTIIFTVQYSERGIRTKTNEILKAIKKKGIAITKEQLERAFRVFKRQGEVDFFINKNAKTFLQEQFKLWSYQHFWREELNVEKIYQIQILKDIAFKVIDFVSKFEDELVKIWNKPKFVKNSNYVITLDKIFSAHNSHKNSDPNFMVERILKHNGIQEQIKEWQELGIVDEDFKIDRVLETELDGRYLAKKYQHLPVDTKYFKDLEPEILGMFDDLDESLNGWLIKSENYQALNTILPKFKDKVQTIYIDPPFNTGEDFSYVDRFKDSSWLSLMSDRITISKQFLNESGSIFVHLDHNAEHLGRILLDLIFENGFVNNLAWSYRTGGASKKSSLPYKHDSILFFAKNIDKFSYKPIYERQYLEKPFIGARKDESGRHYTDTLLRDIIEGVIKDFSNNKIFNTRPVLNLSNEFYGFKTQKPEGLLHLLQYMTLKLEYSLFMDYFAGSGTSLAVAHKLGRKWIGIEMGDYIDNFYVDEIELTNTERNKKNLYKKFVVLNYQEVGDKIIAIVKKIGILGRLKQVLNAKGKNEPCGITTDINWQGGGFFKYYELEQYEESLANCKFDDESITTEPCQQYVFLKNEKTLKINGINSNENKIKFDLSKLYPNVDMAETLSNLTGKWIKKITPLTPLQEGNYEVEFEDGTKINTKDLDYKLIKPLIWWE